MMKLNSELMYGDYQLPKLAGCAELYEHPGDIHTDKIRIWTPFSTSADRNK